MGKVLDGWKGEISVGSQKISNMRYADNTLIIAANQEEMEDIMRCLEEKSKTKLNRSKTKIMIVDRARNNLQHIKEIEGCEVVNSFIYLGSLITNNEGCDREIR
ncbi:unnamed protein product [Diabrotica balteata]|uniref:Reverse transcriptase domain-containing protein n=1 Tax=Diabrotica balteata TaxID=107213 RepID=A0A9N9XA96_DIABA|nr:unnamed protein product [Diabrotica balteata]